MDSNFGKMKGWLCFWGGDMVGGGSEGEGEGEGGSGRGLL